jgi:hypothetical protein
LPNTLFHISWCGRSVGGQRFPSLGLYYGTVFQIEQKNEKEKEKEKDWTLITQKTKRNDLENIHINRKRRLHKQGNEDYIIVSIKLWS